MTRRDVTLAAAFLCVLTAYALWLGPMWGGV